MKVIKELSRGTYIAEDTETNERVILQKLTSEQCEIVSKLNHPNIINYRRTMTDGLVEMEYPSGGTLDEYIRSRKGVFMREDEIIDIFAQLCLAVKYLHDRKIIHRGISTQTIFIDKQTPKLAGFGFINALDFTDQLMKSPAGIYSYIAPEVCRGAEYDSKIDVWALGCVLYEMCALKKAYSGSTPMEILTKIRSGRIPQVPICFSDQITSLIESILIPDPAHRPSINQVLQNNTLKMKAASIIGTDNAFIEFSHTVFHGLKAGDSPEYVSIKANGGVPTRFQFMGRTLVLPSDTNRACEEFIISLTGKEYYRTMRAAIESDLHIPKCSPEQKPVVELIYQLVQSSHIHTE